MDRITELDKVTAKLKEKVLSLPIGQRRAAAKLFFAFTSIVEAEKKEDEILQLARKQLNEQTFALTTDMDNLIEGKKAANDDDVAFWKTQMDEKYTPPKDGDQAAPIPGFWGKFIINTNIHCGEHDAPILQHVTNISTFSEEKVENDKTISVETLVIAFSENTYFKNKDLTIKIKIIDGEPESSEGTKIEWVNNPTVKRKTKNRKNKKTGEVKVVVKEIQLPSFFELFQNFDAEKDEAGSQNSEEFKINIYMVESAIETFTNLISYALEFYLGISTNDNEIIEDYDDEEEEEEEAPQKGAFKKPTKKP